MFIVAIIANFASWKMKVLSVLVDLVVLGIVFAYCAWISKLLSGIAKISKYDKEFSRKGFERRVGYLVRAYERAKDLDISKVRPFMEPSLYARLREQNKYDDFYLLDFEIVKMVVKDFEIKDDKQLAHVTMMSIKLPLMKRRRSRRKRANMILHYIGTKIL